MHFILFDDYTRNDLLPFTHTRPIADIRWGIMTMRERWEYLLQATTATLTAGYLQQAFPGVDGSDSIYINAAVFADEALVEAILALNKEEMLLSNNVVLALRGAAFEPGMHEELQPGWKKTAYAHPVKKLNRLVDLFQGNDSAIQADFSLLTKGRKSAAIPSYVTARNAGQIFVEPGARLQPCILNAEQGPIYIAKDAEIMEGALVRGPLALCEHSVLKMGAKVYGATTIGPGCKVGGEISNVLFFANSNKGHDGFLGNSVIGEWCNLGADTNCSNLKNNYDEVKIWSEHENKLVGTGAQFCGLFMGDHSKCGINTMFNTGTVVGVSCNIYGGGFPDKFLPSFSWGGKEGLTTFKVEKALEAANRMLDRRNRQLSNAEADILMHIYHNTAHQREKEDVPKE